MSDHLNPYYIRRAWAMPDAATFTIKPIAELISRYRSSSVVSLDPFARNSKRALYNNDINPATQALFNLPALDFLELAARRFDRPDLILFDPPYSLRQVKECYQSAGLPFTAANSRNFAWTPEKDAAAALLKPGGIFIHCGWHSNGLGKKRGCEIIEILLVAHGGGHNDTIVTVERKTA